MISFKLFSKTINMTSIGLRYFTDQGVSKKILFEKFGDPLKVLKVVEETLPRIGPTEVLVKFLICPVNPADINLIQGTYPLSVQLPAVAGLEGVAEVVQVGKEVTDLVPGDKVLGNKEGFGTWRTCGVFNSSHLFKIPRELSALEAAGITSNACTAYRMLSDFRYLKAGDVVIQNGGNSACGQNVIQLCHVHNFISVNVVRDRPDIDALKTYLISLGANYVLTEEELRTTSIFKEGIPKPMLALNCIGGRSATDICRTLQDDGVMVTYGGMSREPVTIPTSTFIFKNITAKGFWMTRWNKENKTSNDRIQMFLDLSEFIRNGNLKAPRHKIIPYTKFSEAIMKSSSIQGFTGYKYMLDFQQS